GRAGGLPRGVADAGEERGGDADARRADATQGLPPQFRAAERAAFPGGPRGTPAPAHALSRPGGRGGAARLARREPGAGGVAGPGIRGGLASLASRGGGEADRGGLRPAAVERGELAPGAGGGAGRAGTAGGAGAPAPGPRG